jgi:His-Xaa-Ser system radical SAM maturase HxsC
MCPQPPKPHESRLTEQNYAIIKLIDESYDGDICFTGGEPTVLGNQLLELIKYTADSVPKASIAILTNAKALSEIEFVRNLALLRIKKLLLCVSLHADIDTLHDLIVGLKGSFRKTQLGLYNLARFGIPTEIRVVVSKQNFRRLPQLSEYIYRNYAFACHVTFMGLEMCGLAKNNAEQVWIDPYEYRELLDKAIHSLHQRGMNVSCYNHQLCVMMPKTQSFARKSISSWKNIYISTCDNCSVKSECCGFFSTSESFLSKHIQPLTRGTHK